eukprot:4852586-Pyramimonas_sp.AAC.1
MGVRMRPLRSALCKPGETPLAGQRSFLKTVADARAVAPDQRGQGHRLGARARQGGQSDSVEGHWRNHGRLLVA